ncbi:MAG TPA: nuclear transport factor 2 family protein [Chthoniobacterales bacterium]|nr:nuclear transport factor 2 family protein [Chthoniobacterales bacterium]
MQLRRRPLWTALFLLSASLRATEPSPNEAANAMLDAEREFYQTGQEHGTRAAFLSFLAADGIVFRPGPLNGREVWEKRPETGFDLIWEPTFAIMARSADFGYDTGPAKWRANKKEEKFAGYGQFVSVWKKQTDGSWKVALDLGIEHPAPAGEVEALRFLIPDPDKDPSKKADPPLRRRKLEQAKEGFLAAAKTDFKEALLSSASDHIRVYRDGAFPALGEDAAAQLLGPKQSISMEIMNGDISKSADLAYHYGRYTATRPEGPRAGHFFQIWLTDSAGNWNVVLDWQQALPKN